MECFPRGRTVAPERAAEALRSALAWRGIEADICSGIDGIVVLSLGSGMLVTVEGGCYRWAVGAGLQIHPLTDPQGAAALIADQENDPIWGLRRRHAGWLIMHPAAGILIAVPAAERLWSLPSLSASTPEDLSTAIARAEGNACEVGDEIQVFEL